jgi:hypothetical protein
MLRVFGNKCWEENWNIREAATGIRTKGALA